MQRLTEEINQEEVLCKELDAQRNETGQKVSEIKREITVDLIRSVETKKIILKIQSLCQSL